METMSFRVLVVTSIPATTSPLVTVQVVLNGTCAARLAGGTSAEQVIGPKFFTSTCAPIFLTASIPFASRPAAPLFFARRSRMVAAGAAPEHKSAVPGFATLPGAAPGLRAEIFRPVAASISSGVNRAQALPVSAALAGVLQPTTTRTASEHNQHALPIRISFPPSRRHHLQPGRVRACLFGGR